MLASMTLFHGAGVDGHAVVGHGHADNVGFIPQNIHQNILQSNLHSINHQVQQDGFTDSSGMDSQPAADTNASAEPADAALLSQLQTESVDSAWADRIDTLGTADLCAEFIAHETHVLPAISTCLPVIASLVDALVKRVQAGGRVFYVGAGNSGRVAYMDSSELPATFSADPTQFQALVAGGSQAVIQAQEGAEDSEAGGAAALEELNPTALDAVIGISASGRTPFVLGALRSARTVGCLTAGVTNCQPSGFGRLGVEYLVTVLTGAEFVSGSTRLKAGTAAKQILNMISTCTMVQLGKTYRGLMLDVRVRNQKLRVRGRRILREVCGAGPAYLISDNGSGDVATLAPRKVDFLSEAADAAVDSHIQSCGNSVKLACAVAVSGLDLAAARARLDQVQGHFHRFLELSQSSDPTYLLAGQDDELVLAIDGGGTSCKVAVATRSGDAAYAEAGACNINCATPDELIAQIRTATLCALTRLQAARAGTLGLNHVAPVTAFPRFSRVWVGIAGLHYAFNPDALAYRLEALLSVSVRDGSLRLTSDSLLLGACVGIDDDVQGGLSIIAGTGSVAVAFRKSEGDKDNEKGAVLPVSRSGGWGHLLGDHGSAFDVGRRALQAVLVDIELRPTTDEGEKSAPSALEGAVLASLGIGQSVDLLPRILHDTDREPKHQVAEIARIVTGLAFPEPSTSSSPPSSTFSSPRPDAQALAILKEAASSLVDRVKALAMSRLCKPESDVLVLSGALLNLTPYRELFLDAWKQKGLPAFKKTIVVTNVTDWATQLLLQQSSKVPKTVGATGL